MISGISQRQALATGLVPLKCFFWGVLLAGRENEPTFTLSTISATREIELFGGSPIGFPR